MKLKLLVAAFLILLSANCSKKKAKSVGENNKPKSEIGYRNGDIIFQASVSNQSKAIQLATHSPISHCGLLFSKDGEWQVLEAVGPVKWTPIKDWTARGKDGIYAVNRLKKDMSDKEGQALLKCALKYYDKPYDAYFEWSDKRIYCSELVWKAYKEALRIELGSLQKLKEFDLKSMAVRDKLKERFGSSLPLEEPVISPKAIYESIELDVIESKGLK